MTIRIVIADDHKIVRDGLRNLLDEEKGIEVVGEAGDGRSAVERVHELNPEIVIMDIGMPGLNGFEATRKIRAESPATRVIALSMHSDPPFVGKMLEAGAAGYLLKDCAFDELAVAVRSVVEKGHYLSHRIAGVVIDDYVRQIRGREEIQAPALTAKEREVLQLLAEGGSTKEIAHKLTVSVKTIETHRQNIMNKLDLRSVAELTKYAIREGLTSLDG